jgi:pyruvate,water dikinase
MAGRYNSCICRMPLEIDDAYDHVADDGVYVILQELVDPHMSGVAFSYDLMNSTDENIMIESTFGLCEPLVSGRISPDFCIASKNGGGVLHYEVGRKGNYLFLDNPKAPCEGRVLDNEKITQIKEAVCEIEHLFGHPVDVEWAIDDKLWIVQARPVTRLG